MKEEYQERIAILKKKLNSDISRLEDNIKKQVRDSECILV
ncbi:MbeB family mobilization protein [Escherichia coli]|nr:MbeB family mobilization protein [Escherichia coli]